MKKISALFTTLVLSFALTAQSSMPVPAEQKQPTEQEQVRKDVLVMKGGTVMEMKDGVWLAIESQKTLKEGTRVAPNGTVTRKDGTIIVLKEGESIDWNGVWFPAKDGKTRGE